MAPKTELRIGVIGCGGHFRHHGAALAHIRDRRRAADDGPPIILAGACDVDVERAEAYRTEFDFRAAYTDMHEMIAADRPDAVLVMTPAESNARIATELLRYGVPLLIEKPPGGSEREAIDLADAVRAAEVPVMVSFDRRFTPAVQQAKTWLAKRQVDYVEATMLRNRRTEPDFPTETGIHLVDTVHYLVGATTRVEPRTLRRAGRPSNYVGSLIGESGVLSRYTILPACGRQAETYVLHGADFTLIVDRMAGTLRVSEEGRTELLAAPGGAETSHETHVTEMSTFFDCLVHGRVFPSTMDNGVLAVRVAHEIASAAPEPLGE